LTNVDAEVHTVYGPILVSWEQSVEEKSVIYHVTIPNSLHSIITFDPVHPTARCISIEESDVLIWDRSSSLLKTDVSGIVWLRPDSIIDGAINVRTEGGSYRWKVRWD
jgi:hypothetical protein